MAKNKRSNRKLITRLLVVVLTIVFLVACGVIWNHKRSVTKQTPSGTSTNLASATEEEKQETEQHKQELSNGDTTQLQTGADGRKQVTPIISYADTTTITAYITGIFEEDGTCTATLTNGSKTITKTSIGFQNASYTQCTPIDLTGSPLGSSNWSVTVSYSSATAIGKSDPSTIKP